MAKDQLQGMPAPLLDPELLTIRVVEMCAKAGFAPRGNYDVTQAETINTCAILVEFCTLATMIPNRPYEQWLRDIENLRITLKGKT